MISEILTRWFAVLTLSSITLLSGAPSGHSADLGSYEWIEVNGDAEWAARAGLQVVQLKNSFYLMGGRTPIQSPIPGDSTIWSDVWRSSNQGLSWTRILDTDGEGHWPARAYFEAVTKGRYIYVLGGQNFITVPNNCPPGVPGCPPFISTSEFFNDVWRSRDGVNWRRLTENAGWEGRAGLSAVVHRNRIYVMGGSVNDDSAIVGGPPARVYFNDVWRSFNGRDWERMTANAPWEARAGASVVSKDGYIYLLGGEDGFLCDPLPFCELPYFNDVWRSRDGAEWERVTPAADWAPRPGHKCAVVGDEIVCFGGFGPLGNPVDVWSSSDGAEWDLIGTPWNAVTSDEIKYDFDAMTVRGGTGVGTSIFSFGGDRETFDFTDPTNFLRVDNDVWRFSPPPRERPGKKKSKSKKSSKKKSKVKSVK